MDQEDQEDQNIGAQLQRLQDEFIALQNSTQAISEEQEAQIESLISENESLKAELALISHDKQDLLAHLKDKDDEIRFLQVELESALNAKDAAEQHQTALMQRLQSAENTINNFVAATEELQMVWTRTFIDKHQPRKPLSP